MSGRRTLSLALCAVLWAGSARSAPPPHAATTLCARSTAEELPECRRECASWPASPRCLLLRRFGAVGLRVLEQAQSGGLAADVVARKLGLGAGQARAIAVYLDAEQLQLHSWVPSPLLSAAQQAELQEATALNEEMRRLFRAAYYSLALLRSDRVLEIRRRLLGGAHPLTAQAINNRAHLLKTLGQLERSERLHRQALAARTQHLGAAHPETANSHNNLGAVLEASGRLDEALQHYRTALEIDRTALGADHPRSGGMANNVGAALQQLGRLDEARHALELAVAVFETTAGPADPRTATALLNLGVLLDGLGEVDRAIEIHTRALASMRTALRPKHPRIAAATSGLAHALLRKGRLRDAQRAYEESLDILAAALGPAHPDVLAARHNLTHLMSEAGDLPGARDRYTALLRSTRERFGDHPTTATIAENLGTLFARHFAEPVRSKRLLADALRMRRKVQGDWHPQTGHARLLLAEAAWRRGERGLARTQQRRGLAVLRHHFQVNVDAARSDLEILRFLGTVRAPFDTFLSFFDEPDDSRVAFEAALAWQGAATAAEQLWRDLARAREGASAQVQTLLAEYRRVQRERLRQFMAPSEKKGARDRARARALDAERRRIEQKLEKRSPAFARRREVLAADLDAVCDRLRAGGGAVLVDYVAYRYLAPAPPGRSEERYLAFVVGAKGAACRPVRVELGLRGPIDAAVAAYRAAIAEDERCVKQGGGRRCAWKSGTQSAAAQLRKRVWDPLEAALPPGGKLWIVPDGRLGEVPFAAFGREGGRFLIEDFEIGYLPFPAAILRRQGALAAGSATRALVVGDVDYASADARHKARLGWRLCSPDGPCRLAGPAQPVETVAQRAGGDVCGYDARWTSLGRTEAADVARVLGREVPGGALLVTGRSATEETLRDALRGRRVIHLATHGFFSPAGSCGPTGGKPGGLNAHVVDPLRLSAVVLAGANQRRSPGGALDRDGILSAREVVSLDLRQTEVVTLSACETGLGERVPGEGAQGLGRAFLVAGARAALVSLWKVDSEATALLFEAFYEAAYRGGSSSDPVAALRRAQLGAIEEARKRGVGGWAYRWAAFVPVIGVPALKGLPRSSR